MRECPENTVESAQNRSATADYNGFTHYEAHVRAFLTFFLQVRDFVEIVYGIPLAKPLKPSLGRWGLLRVPYGLYRIPARRVPS